MPITASTLYRDSFNFMRNQLGSILLLCVLTALITVILNQIFMPGSDQLSVLSAGSDDLLSNTGMSIQELVQSMSPDQQKVLLQVSAAATFSALIGNVLLVGGMLVLLQQVSGGMRTSALRALGAAAPIMPRLFGLMLICTLLVQLGLTLFVVPGIVLAVATSLSPVLCVNEKLGVFKSVKVSSKLAFANLRLVVPAIMFWLAAKMVLLLVVSRLAMLSPDVAAVILSALSNLVSAILLIYLFRLYTKLRV